MPGTSGHPLWIRVPANSLRGGHIQPLWGQKLKVTWQGQWEASTSPGFLPGNQGPPTASTLLPPASVQGPSWP